MLTGIAALEIHPSQNATPHRLPGSMNPAPLLLFQFLWFSIAWTVVAVLLVLPRLRGRDPADAVALCTSPQMFRVAGVGLLVPNLAPGMPWAFAAPTAALDALTAALAVGAVVALSKRRPWAFKLAWACHLVGMADLAVALPHGVAVGAARFLAAQWYVPALVVPLMIVSHAMAVRLLLEQRHARSAVRRGDDGTAGTTT